MAVDEPPAKRVSQRAAMSGMGFLLSAMRSAAEPAKSSGGTNAVASARAKQAVAATPAAASTAAETTPVSESKSDEATAGVEEEATTSAGASTSVERQATPPPPPPLPPAPVRVAVAYGALNVERAGRLPLTARQTIADCFRAGTTPRFSFAAACEENNYVRSCRFAPSGRWLVSDAEDRQVRVFRVEEDAEQVGARAVRGGADARARLQLHLHSTTRLGGLIYDVAWSPDGERFVTTCTGGAIQSWSVDGEQLHSYLGITHLVSARARMRGVRADTRRRAQDTLDSAYCVAMDAASATIYAGYRGRVRRFRVERPGRQHSELRTDGECRCSRGACSSAFWRLCSCGARGPKVNPLYDLHVTAPRRRLRGWFIRRVSDSLVT